MRFNAYLGFDGRCEEAFNFYQKVIGGKIEAMIRHEDTPMADQASPEWRGKIVHARLNLDGSLLMGGDAPAGQYEAMKGCSVLIDVGSAQEAERIFNALSEQGTVRMPIQKTFWAERFGMLADRFGIAWMINCEAAK